MEEHYEEFSACNNYMEYEIPLVHHIGWLAVGHHYPKGEVPLEFIEQLLSVIANLDGPFQAQVNLTRCFPRCQFCGDTEFESVYVGACDILTPSQKKVSTICHLPIIPTM